MNNKIIDSKIVNISSDDMGSQIIFYESNDDDSNYFLIQKFYGDYEVNNDNSCYIESNMNGITGFYNKIIKLINEKSLEIKTDKFSVILNFDIPEVKLNKLKKVLGYIIK